MKKELILCGFSGGRYTRNHIQYKDISNSFLQFTQHLYQAPMDDSSPSGFKASIWYTPPSDSAGVRAFQDPFGGYKRMETDPFGLKLDE